MKIQRTKTTKLLENLRTTDPSQIWKSNVHTFPKCKKINVVQILLKCEKSTYKPVQNVRKSTYYRSFSNVKKQRTKPSKMLENQSTTDPFQMWKINVPRCNKINGLQIHFKCVKSTYKPFQNVRKSKSYRSFSNVNNQPKNLSKM